MIRITVLGLVSAAMLITSGAFAAGEKSGDKGCCAAHAQNVANNEKGMCADLAVLNLNADQKTKIEAWQAECMKDGCTKEARHKFFTQAKGVLSAEQFGKLKAECKKTKEAQEAKTTT
jgi:hypothetical protein